MPLYDFACRSCGEQFEARASESERPACPGCGAPGAERVLSPFAGPFTTRPRGRDARRVDADRRVREEQRAERREARRPNQ
jgi:putative FmdB family regulatory protein